MTAFYLLTALLLVAQAPVPVPRETPARATAATSNVKTESNKKDGKPAPPVPLTDFENTQRNETHSGEQTKKDQPYSVVVRELPPVSTTKDWADWGLWIFNLLLTCVGGLQILILVKTLGAVKRQAVVMQEQLDTTRQRERPKVRMELADLDLNFAESPDMILIGCKVKNHGGSDAFLLDSEYSCWVAKAGDPDGAEHEAVNTALPDVLVAKRDLYDVGMFIPDEEKIVEWTLWAADDPRIESVRRGDASVYLSGTIKYKNIFDETWTLHFKRKYTVYHYTEEWSLGRWSGEGEAHNYERKETQSKEKAKDN